MIMKKFIAKKQCFLESMIWNIFWINSFLLQKCRHFVQKFICFKTIQIFSCNNIDNGNKMAQVRSVTCRANKSYELRVELISWDALAVAAVRPVWLVRKFVQRSVNSWHQFRKCGNRIVSFYPARFAQRYKFTFSTRCRCFRLDKLS